MGWGWPFSSSAPKAAEAPPPTPAPVAIVVQKPVVVEAPVAPIRTKQEQRQRSVQQLGLFTAGATFLLASTLITRRSVSRKTLDAFPKFYQPSHGRPPPNRDTSGDQLVAVEALGLATLNVFSFAIMMTGGLAWAFDVSNVEDLRRRARKGLYGPNGVTDEAAEEQIEEWLAGVLLKKENREKEEVKDTKKGR